MNQDSNRSGAVMTYLEKRVAELEAQQEISELRAWYARYGLRGEGEKAAGLFTEECLFETLAGAERIALRSRAALQQFLGRFRPAPGSVLPLMHNQLTTIEGDEAHGWCVLQRPATAGAPAMVGRYVEKFKRVNGRWLFSQRLLYRAHPEWEDEPISHPGTEP